MAKIVTLGEIMLRLSPNGNDRFIQSESFRIIPGGGEGKCSYFSSKLRPRRLISYQNFLSMRLVRLQLTRCVVMVSIQNLSPVVATVWVFTMLRQVLPCVLQR